MSTMAFKIRQILPINQGVSTPSPNNTYTPLSAPEPASFAPCRPPAQRAPGAVRLTIFPGRAHGAEESDWTAVLGDEV